MRHDTRPYLLFIWLTIAITFILIILVQSADGAVQSHTYLPMVTKQERSFKITGADCGYIYVEATGYPELSTDYYAGSFTVRKYPSLPMQVGTLHYWPEQSTDTVKRYWGAAEFEIGVLYYLDAWVKCYGGQCWVENGDELWMPCQPHAGQGELTGE